MDSSPTKTPALTRKQTGLVLIILGVFMAGLIFVFLYFKTTKVAGFPELVPSEETALYAEFPAKIPADIALKLKETLNIDWDKDVSPWAQEKSALVLLTQENQLLPFLLSRTASVENAYKFLKTYKNPFSKIQENRLNGFTAFTTPAISFAFISDNVIVSPSQKGLEKFLSYQSGLVQHLGNDRYFIKSAKNAEGQFFIYLKPKSLPNSIYSFISTKVPRMPMFSKDAFRSVAFAMQKQEKFWTGKSYALFNDIAFVNQEQAYNARLLPFLPMDAQFVLGGQNLSSQIKKTELLLKNDTGLPLLTTYIASFLKNYLPDINFEKQISLLLSSEFAITVNGSKILAVLELNHQVFAKNIEDLRASFLKTAPRLAPKIRETELADGTKASEFVPSAFGVKETQELWDNAIIHGILMNENAVYDAVIQDKWFISNDLATIKKSIALTKEPGLNFRESRLYKNSLQPILKNPELLGLSAFEKGVFSFSKRTFTDHMETNFMWIAD